MRFLISLAALAAIACTARADWSENTDGSWTYKAKECICGPGCDCPPGDCPGACKVSPVQQQVVVPRGYHAHTTLDGRTIVHSDANMGSAAAHAGIARPWPKSALPGQVVTVDAAPTENVAANTEGSWVQVTTYVQECKRDAAGRVVSCRQVPVSNWVWQPSQVAAVAPPAQATVTTSSYSTTSSSVSAGRGGGLFHRVRQWNQNRAHLFGGRMGAGGGSCPTCPK